MKFKVGDQITRNTGLAGILPIVRISKTDYYFAFEEFEIPINIRETDRDFVLVIDGNDVLKGML